ncbi:MAG: UDP-N-acetylmuramoyl-tripeptide--D-alanyl-D-alanine ligase [Methylovulum sp.]|nr:UDP-N-acetylmuramoyl-tripeptide--D-alanyl-D-alanine ligase [Methylovulum sp.]
MNMMLSEIAKCVQGQLVGTDIAIASVSIDTRAIQPGQLYVAIKGPQFDGNDFVGTAEQAGAVAAMVHPGIKATVPHIIVADTRLALAELAGAWRQKAAVSLSGMSSVSPQSLAVGRVGSMPTSTLPPSLAVGRVGSIPTSTLPPSLAVVGVTGSNGKTTVKEMTAAILAASEPTPNPGQVLYTLGNFNNDIGVPLTLLRLNGQHRYAVIEMGANHPGEIAYTSRYAQADVVILNNAGAAHIEGFGSLDGVAQAKGEIIATLKQSGVAVLNRDDAYFDYWKSVAGDRKVLSFGVDGDADVSAQGIKTSLSDNGFVTTFELVTKQGTQACMIKLAGLHNVVNALAATAASLALNISLAQIVRGLAQAKPVTGRLQLLQGRLGNRVIDDTYNANAASLKVGLDVLGLCAGPRWLVLGAFGELGPDSPDMHYDMGGLIKACGVVRMLAMGGDALHTVRAFGDGATFFASQDDLIAELLQELKGDETILIKGSRVQRMEQVAAALVENFRN